MPRVRTTGDSSAGGDTSPLARRPRSPQESRFFSNLFKFLALLVLGFSGMVWFFTFTPTVSSDVCDNVSPVSIIVGPLPKFIGGKGDLLGTTRETWRCTEAMRQDHPGFVMAAFIIVYVTFQAFAIPGPLVLSILSGALYPPLYAQGLIAVCATVGASICYALSYFLGKDIMERLVPQMLGSFREKIKSNRDNLVYYMLFLRITPLLPNWFVNLASPIVDVPFKTFVFATFFGQMPANYFHVKTGSALSSLKNLSMKENMSTFLLLFALQFVALLPTLLKGWIQRYEQQRFAKRES